MIIIKSTYLTLSGVKEIIEAPNSKGYKWVIYLNNKPTFFVDLYDLSIESNSMMNSLVLCAKSRMEEVLKKINKRNNIHLSVPKISKLGIKKKLKSEPFDIKLKPLPEEWLDYSL